MARRPRNVVTRESDPERNLEFQDTKTGHRMSRAAFVQRIEADHCRHHHVRKVNGLKTPVSNPDGSESNDLD